MNFNSIKRCPSVSQKMLNEVELNDVAFTTLLFFDFCSSQPQEIESNAVTKCRKQSCKNFSLSQKLTNDREIIIFHQ